MFNVLYFRITEQHDLRLVILAAFICILGCFTVTSLFVHAQKATARRRLPLTFGAAAVFGASVWATHFIAELAFQPGMPVAYEFDLTALSLLIAVLMATLGMVVALQHGRPWAGGLVVGAAVAAMHYTGIAALRVSADIEWNLAYVAVSLMTGGLGAGAAIWVLCHGRAWHNRMSASLLLVLAIFGLHFAAMAAIVLVPNPLVVIPKTAVAPELLAVMVAAVSIVIVMLGLAVSIFEEQSARRAIREAEQLRLSREHLAEAQRIAGLGSMEVDLRTGLITWSAELCRIFGVDPGEVQPTAEYMYQFIHPADRAAVVAAVEHVHLSGIAAPPLEYRIIRGDGAVRTVYRENAVLLDGNGRPSRRILIFKDVTGLITWSAELSRIFGVDPGDAQPTADTQPNASASPSFRDAVAAAVEQVPLSGVTVPSLEYRIVRSDGAVRTVYRENAILLDEHGQPSRRILIYKDMTELHAAQERERELYRQLMHSQKLEALGTLAGGIAHDLNNTLVPILALAKLALDDLPEDNPIRDDIATIMRASERARDLVKQILTYSRKQDLFRQEVDLAAVMREALQMLRASLPATIRIDEAIEPVPRFFGDAGELHQVIVNLVTNAAQAIGPEMGVISVSVSTADGSVRLSVADTGCGMDAATAERIFEPFFTTKGVGEGTGLGLSVVHGIVKAHGGRIEVSSIPGQGTTFAIHLPAAEAAASVEREAVAA